MPRAKAIGLCAMLMLLLLALAGVGAAPQMESGGEPDIPPMPPKLIAHAGGAVYGYRLTNSLEALDHAYENGFRCIELDFERTNDGAIVLLHDWESMAERMLFSAGQRSREEFLASESFADLTLVDLAGLLEWLDKHPNCWIVTDAKCGNFPFLSELKEAAGENAARFIPQVYSYEEYDAAHELGFEDIILTLYLMDCVEEELCAFAAEKKPWAVTIPEKYLSETLLVGLGATDTLSYTHTVNELSYFERWREAGLYGIYTDHFIPAKWPY